MLHLHSLNVLHSDLWVAMGPRGAKGGRGGRALPVGARGGQLRAGGRGPYPPPCQPGRLALSLVRQPPRCSRAAGAAGAASGGGRGHAPTASPRARRLGCGWEALAPLPLRRAPTNGRPAPLPSGRPPRPALPRPAPQQGAQHHALNRRHGRPRRGRQGACGEGGWRGRSACEARRGKAPRRRRAAPLCGCAQKRRPRAFGLLRKMGHVTPDSAPSTPTPHPHRARRRSATLG
jgi:hypothetical protein